MNNIEYNSVKSQMEKDLEEKWVSHFNKTVTKIFDLDRNKEHVNLLEFLDNPNWNWGLFDAFMAMNPTENEIGYMSMKPMTFEFFEKHRHIFNIDTICRFQKFVTFDLVRERPDLRLRLACVIHNMNIPISTVFAEINGRENLIEMTQYRKDFSIDIARQYPHLHWSWYTITRNSGYKNIDFMKNTDILCGWNIDEILKELQVPINDLYMKFPVETFAYYKRQGRIIPQLTYFHHMIGLKHRGVDRCEWATGRLIYFHLDLGEFNFEFDKDSLKDEWKMAIFKKAHQKKFIMVLNELLTPFMAPDNLEYSKQIGLDFKIPNDTEWYAKMNLADKSKIYLPKN